MTMKIASPCKAFVSKHQVTVNRLMSAVTVIYGGVELEVLGLWDTGATSTCISEEVAQKLSMRREGFRDTYTPSGKSTRNTYTIDLRLPNNVQIDSLLVSDSEIGLQGLGVLVGMDVIGKGDFAVSNFDGKTVFTFRMPSQKVTDYVAQIIQFNTSGPKHGKGKRAKSRK